jgi:hypothetical protein
MKTVLVRGINGFLGSHLLSFAVIPVQVGMNRPGNWGVEIHTEFGLCNE